MCAPTGKGGRQITTFLLHLLFVCAGSAHNISPYNSNLLVRLLLLIPFSASSSLCFYSHGEDALELKEE